MSSRRGYLTIAELEEYANLTVTDQAEAFDQISQAEELIDQYVGYQSKHVEREIVGLAQGGTTTSFTLAQHHQASFENNYFKYCQVEIIDGTGDGQRVRILSNDKDSGVITTETFTTAPNDTSFYKITQLGKFPRQKDSVYYSEGSATPKWRKNIPEMVRRATAAQVQFMREMGDSYFTGQQAGLLSEQIGDYSYERGANSPGGVDALIAPKAIAYLRGITNRTGQIVV